MGRTSVHARHCQDLYRPTPPTREYTPKERFDQVGAMALLVFKNDHGEILASATPSHQLFTGAGRSRLPGLCH